jgi:hypothetical protein
MCDWGSRCPLALKADELIRLSVSMSGGRTGPGLCCLLWLAGLCHVAAIPQEPIRAEKERQGLLLPNAKLQVPHSGAWTRLP